MITGLIAAVVILAAPPANADADTTLTAPDATTLRASDGAVGDHFGRSVSISGDTVVIGAEGDDDRGEDAGSAHVFVRNGTTWFQQAELTASDGAAGDYFGTVSFSGDTALVGAWADDGFGSAYVFVRTGTTWSQQAKLLPSDRVASGGFGLSVSVQGDTALIGDPFEDLPADERVPPDYFSWFAGSAYVFVRSGTSWSQQAKLLPSDRGALDLFGWSVSVSGDTAVIGQTSGSAYVFVRSGTTWSQQAKLLPSDGGECDEFGTSVFVDGDTTLVGAPRCLQSNIYTGIVRSGKGSAYVFVRNGTTWSEQATLMANDGREDDSFGYSVSIDGGTAVVGAPGPPLIYGSGEGSAYVFVRSGTMWAEDARLTASDCAMDGSFGMGVSIDEDAAVVGMPLDKRSTGSVSVFHPVSGPWTAPKCPNPVTPDGSNPIVAITSPTRGATLASTSVTLSGTASDDVAVEKVEIRANGGAWVLASGTTTWAGTMTLHEGANVISARATDTSGNVAAVSIDVIVEAALTSESLSGELPVAIGSVLIAIGVVAGVLWVRRRARIRTPPE